MLVTAHRKTARRGRRLPLVAADALQLPLRSESVDIVTVAFGIRNFEDLATGLGELSRVLRPAGTLLVLEFSRPHGPFAPLLARWVRSVPPRLGRLVSSDRNAYDYLSASVAGFADSDEVCERLAGAGFESIEARPLTWGVATLYEARRASAGGAGDEEET
jgi:demethylmenaquinone methyltransferase/2-methoxy-6-polyprenyl-1,4-benzoquinol methylase